jgi:hypothetical protein
VVRGFLRDLAVADQAGLSDSAKLQLRTAPTLAVQIEQAQVGALKGEDVTVTAKRSVIAMRMGSPYPLGHLAPNERHNLIELGTTWAANVESWAAHRLPKIEEAA